MNEISNDNMIDNQIIIEDAPNNKISNNLLDVPLLQNDKSTHSLIPEDDKKNLIMLNIFDPSTKSYKSLNGVINSNKK